MTQRWQVAATTIEQHIATGDYSGDGCLPTEAELCAELGVSRITVRRALDALRAEGLVVAGRGRGWRIAGSEAGRPVGLFRVTTQKGRDSVPVSTETLTFQICAATPTDPGIGTRVLRVLRLGKSDGTPVDLVEIVIGGPYASQITEAEIDTFPPALLLVQKGSTLGRTDQWATAELATPDDTALEVEPGTPLLVVHRTVFEADTPILRTTHRSPGHLVRLDVTFPITSTADAAPVRFVRDDGS